MYLDRIAERITALQRRLGLDGNPIRRRTDRIEAGATLAAIVIVIAALPAALGIGFAVYQTNMAEVARQHASTEHVTALLTDSPPVAVTETGGATVFLAQAQWNTVDGSQHSGRIEVPANAGPQSVVGIWTTPDGAQVQPPLMWESALGRGGLAVCGAVAALSLLLWCMILIARWRLNRRRSHDWDTEWRHFGPQWTPSV